MENKSTKIVPPLESETMREMCEYLQDESYFFWRSNNIPVFAKNNAGNMTFRALPKFTPRGLPDIMLVHAGYFIGIEVKRLGAKLRPAQEAFGQALSERGGIYWCLYSVNELRSNLSRFFAKEAKDGALILNRSSHTK